MDLMTYEPPLPELPLLRGVRVAGGGQPLPSLRIDWAAYVMRLAQVMAERDNRPSAA